MELKPGISEEWETKRIGDFTNCTSGGTPSTSVHLYWGGSIKWMSSGELNLKQVSEVQGRITELGLRSSSAKMIPNKCVLVGLAGQGKTRGTVAINLTELCTNQSIAAILPNHSFVSEYLYYNLDARYDELRSLSTGDGGRGGLNLTIIKALPVPFPDLNEQAVIAAVLSDTDALLSSLDRLLAKKRDIKQAVMQQLLTGKQRLPGFGEEWEIKRLGDFGKCLRGVSYKGDSDLSFHDTDTTIRLLRSNNVQGATINIKDVQFVNRERVSEQQQMQANDVLICMANGSKELVGKAGIFKITDGHVYTFGAFMGCYRTRQEVAHPAFVFFLFQTNQYRDYINNLLAGSSINNLKPSSIESLEFPVPLLPEQIAIAAVLSDMDAEIDALTQRRDKTRAIKQGMMQELLTGRTRLV